jgi:Mor family transcriptional regulator
MAKVIKRGVQGRLGRTPYRGPELLLDLSERLARELIAVCGIPDDAAYRVAMDAVKVVAEAYGGGQIYFPRPRHGKSHVTWFDLQARDLQIYRAYNGRNTQAVCKRYGISRERVRQIVLQVRLERRAQLARVGRGSEPAPAAAPTTSAKLFDGE